MNHTHLIPDFKMKQTIFFLICIVAGTYSEFLRCYDCDPDDGGNCVTTETVKITSCEENSDTLLHATSSYVKNEIQNIDRLDIEGRANLSEILFECFSLYYESPDDSDDIKSGVYRGCFSRNSNIASSCYYLTERFNKGNITKCISCSSDNCNNEYVGGAAELSISLGVIMANLIICLNIYKL